MKHLLALLLCNALLIASGCTSDTSGGGTGGTSGGTGSTNSGEDLGPFHYVIDEIIFPDKGVAVGFDIDNEDNSDTPETLCGKADRAGGIDNQLSEVLFVAPGLEVANGGLRESIANGEILLLATLSSVEDLINDSSVSVTVAAAVMATPTLDATGKLAAGQTFTIDTSSPQTTFTASITNGVLTAGPSDNLSLALPFFNETTEELVQLGLTVNDAMLSFTFSEERLTQGTGGGSISNVELAQEAANAGYPEVELETIQSLADIDPGSDGCERVSVGFSITAVAATFTN